MTTTPSPPNDPAGAEELTGETLEDLGPSLPSHNLTPSQEAAAFHGSALNAGYTLQDRLALALKALEFYAAESRPGLAGCRHPNHVAECADCGAKPLQGLR